MADEAQKDSRDAAPIDPQTTQLDTAALRKPDEKLDPATPIGDEAQAAAKASTTAEEDDEPDDDDEYDDLTENTEFPPLEKAKSYKVDIKRALERETQDGKGDDEVPESDFVSFATERVEREND